MKQRDESSDIARAKGKNQRSVFLCLESIPMRAASHPMFLCQELSGFVGDVVEDCNTCNASLTLSGATGNDWCKWHTMHGSVHMPSNPLRLSSNCSMPED